MKRIFVATIVAMLAATVIPFAQSTQTIPVAESESSSLWFVELSNPPTSGRHGGGVTLEREEMDFHAAAASARVQYSNAKHFRELWNGLTVRASGRNADKLRGLAGVQIGLPRGEGQARARSRRSRARSSDLVTAIKMTGVDIAQNELGLTGRGVRVAIMDTGIDYDHPDLGGCFGPGCRVEKGLRPRRRRVQRRR